MAQGENKVNSLGIDDLGPFCVNQKLFKVYQYITQLFYGRPYLLTSQDIPLLKTDDEEIRSFLLRSPQVWRSSSYYKHFRDLCEAGEVAQLRREVADLRDKVTALWYSPGMPGYVLAQESFEEGRPCFAQNLCLAHALL